MNEDPGRQTVGEESYFLLPLPAPCRDLFFIMQREDLNPHPSPPEKPPPKRNPPKKNEDFF